MKKRVGRSRTNARSSPEKTPRETCFWFLGRVEGRESLRATPRRRLRWTGPASSAPSRVCTRRCHVRVRHRDRLRVRGLRPGRPAPSGPSRVASRRAALPARGARARGQPRRVHAAGHERVPDRHRPPAVAPRHRRGQTRVRGEPARGHDRGGGHRAGGHLADALAPGPRRRRRARAKAGAGALRERQTQKRNHRVQARASRQGRDRDRP